MDVKRPKRLNFNAPLLSTRRTGGHSGIEERRDTSNRVPFCWEQAPGRPKNPERRDGINDEAETPRPRLPPSRWRPPIESTYNGDAREKEDENGDDLSLTEAIDILERGEHFPVSDGFNSEDSSSDGSKNPSPNFIIERFLPDATALAAAFSALNPNEKLRLAYDYPETLVTKADPPKGCGLEILLPWHVKHRVCGVKSPIEQSTAVLQPTPKLSSVKRKKHLTAEKRCK
ncbi:hypothetical protein SLA2020_385400 [Shorea laevis]